MAEPVDPGTQPSLIANLEGRAIEAPRFNFPNGMRGLPDSGPLGPMPGDATYQKPPILGYATFPGIRAVTFTSQTASPFRWDPYDCTRPVVLMPFRSTIPNGELGTMAMRFAPGATGTSIAGGGVNDRHGYRSSRLACHLFAPGRWFLSLGGAADTQTIDFLELPCEDRTIAEQLLFRAGACGEALTQVASVAVPAATVTIVLQMNVALLLDFVRVVNAGANPVRLKWSGAPTAADGFGIAAGGHLDFPPETMSVAVMRAFSTAGTTVEVWGVRRNWSS